MLDLSLLEPQYCFRIEDFQLLSANRKIYKLQTNKGVFVLKPVSYPPKEFAFIKNACNYLAKKNCNVSAVLPDKDGNFTMAINDENNCKQVFFLMKYISGRTADFKNPKHLRQIAGALADLHQNSFGFHSEIFADRNKIGHFSENVMFKIRNMQKWQLNLQTKKKLNYFDYLYSGYAAKYINQSFQVWESLQKYYAVITKKFKRIGCICHHDLANHNILITNENRLSRQSDHSDFSNDFSNVGFVDFDYCISDIFVHDLASVLLRIGKTNNYNPQPALAFLTEYENSLPLTNDERLLLWDYLRFPQDFWQMGLAFYEETPSMDNAKQRQTRCGRLDKRLTEYVDSAEKRYRFLQTLRSGII